MQRVFAKVARFALLGAVTGAIAAAPFAADLELGGFSFYVIPGLVFGLAFGVALLRRGLLRRAGALIYAAAAVLSYFAAVQTSIYLLDPVSHVVDQHWAAEIVVGIAGGAVGGGLLAGVAAFLLPIGRWPLLVMAGGILGVFLPLWVSSKAGAFAFYIIWQSGYAAILAAILPRTERI